MSDDSRPAVDVEAAMAEVREAVRQRLGTGEDADAIALEHLLRHARERHNQRRSLLVRYLNAMDRWRLDEPLTFSSHRGAAGKLIIALKERVLFPLNRWLFEYLQRKIAQQQDNNELLISLIETLARENEELRQRVDALEKNAHGNDAAVESASEKR